MNKPFTILHLSDIHLGKSENKWDSDVVLKSLLEDLSGFSAQENLIPNIIIFSGDLAYSGVKEQYDLAKEFFNKVSAIFQNTPKWFVVPGNHDVNRKKIDAAYKQYRNTLTADIVEKMMTDNTDEFQTFLKRQDDWKDFAQNQLKESGFNLCEIGNYVTGVIEHDENKIGIIGLNSSWACQDEEDINKLWIGKNQFERANSEINDVDFKIVVTHHPVNWLHQEESIWFKQRFQTQFNLYLHGHEHSGWLVPAEGHVAISARASYESSKTDNGYGWIRIDLTEKKAEIFLRKFSDEGSSGWIPHVISGLTDNAGHKNINSCFKENPKPSKVEEKVAVNTLSKKDESKITLNLPEFISYLDKDFRFIWERPETSVENAVIFWAVRLRTPTPIHAVQSFVAAGLQKLGCEVILWLDDLGRTDYSDKGFFARVDWWFEKVGGDKTKLGKRKFTELYESEDNALFFRSYVQRWLGENNIYKLSEVLKVSKLTKPEDNSIDQLSDRKPRRILTPSMVWATLAILLKEQPNRTVITLGGYDEEPLWRAWKECIREEDTITGHLYTPVLKDEKGVPIHMETFKIGWNNRNDVLNTIQEEINKEGWENQDRFIPWCFDLFSLLPRAISGNEDSIKIGDKKITSFRDIIELNLNQNELINFFTDEFYEWIVYS